MTSRPNEAQTHGAQTPGADSAMLIMDMINEFAFPGDAVASITVARNQRVLSYLYEVQGACIENVGVEVHCPA